MIGIYFLARHTKTRVIHAAVREGGGNVHLMVFKCGRTIRKGTAAYGMYQFRQRQTDTSSNSEITCKACRNN